jgi:L-rhamnonate dehydratase
MKITNTEIISLEGTMVPHGPKGGNRQCQALDIYEEFDSKDWSHDGNDLPQPVCDLYVKINCDSKLHGLFGPIDSDQAHVIKTHLAPFLEGRDPLASEKIHDQMMRMNRHGRSGLFVTGISAIDCALWDLKGKYYEEPIYRLMGGPVREKIPAYASMLGFSTEPERAKETALEYKEMGYTAQKWFFRWGPGQGEAGMDKNMALAAGLREVLGENYPLMFDAFWGWDATYARRMLTLLEQVNPAWMEEVVSAERTTLLADLQLSTTIPLAGGEHVYTRWQVREYLEHRAVQVIQADPDWCGGITELLKIADMCSAFEVPCIAHGHSLLSALQVAGARSRATVPYVEYLIGHQERKQHFFKEKYKPVKGYITLPETPGLGIILP